MAAGPGDRVGVWIDGGQNDIVGGTVPAAANTLGFNTAAAVSISGNSATGNQVLGNLIGGRRHQPGQRRGHRHLRGCHEQYHRWHEPGPANTIADNAGDAVQVLSGSGTPSARI